MFKSLFPHLRCLAMTATAPPKWRELIEQVICMQGPLISFIDLAPRTNLTFNVNVHHSLEVRRFHLPLSACADCMYVVEARLVLKFSSLLSNFSFPRVHRKMCSSQSVASFPPMIPSSENPLPSSMHLRSVWPPCCKKPSRCGFATSSPFSWLTIALNSAPTTETKRCHLAFPFCMHVESHSLIAM